MVVPGKKERTTYTFRSPNFFQAEWGAASQSNGQDGVKLSLLRNPHDTTQNTSFRVPAFPDGMPTAPVLVPNIRCQICDDNHSTGSCSYLREIPENTKIIEDSAFEIVCQCNKPIVGGACSGYCLPPLSRKVAPKHYPLCPPTKHLD